MNQTFAKTPQPVHVDVLVIGCGPVGQTLAIKLAQNGWTVAVLERQPAPYAMPRAVGYDHEISRILQSCGVAEAMRPLVAPIAQYEWRDAAGRPLITFPDLDHIEISGWPAGTSFSQPDLEQVLEARLRCFGEQVTILRGWEVIALREDVGGVEVVARPFGRDDAGERRTVTASFAMGCDGAGSFVRDQMGFSFIDLGFSEDWVVADLQPIDPGRWDRSMIQICDPHRPTTLVCGGPGRRRVEWMLLPGETREDFADPASVWPLLAPLGWTSETARLERVATYHFRGCVARRWVSGRVAIAGDAAHLTPPFAGQGLCAGMRDAQALAWRLHLMLAGHAGHDLLQSYEAERAANVTRFIEFAIGLGQVICVSDPAQAARRDAEFRSRGPGALGAYPDCVIGPSDLLLPGDPQAGRLALQAPVNAGGSEQLLDCVTGSGFVMLGWGHDPAQGLSGQQRSFCAASGVALLGIETPGGVSDITGAYGSWFATLGASTVLVRPDFYVFGTGEPHTLVGALEAAFAGTRPEAIAPSSRSPVPRATSEEQRAW